MTETGSGTPSSTAPGRRGDATVIWEAVERSRSWLDAVNGTSPQEQTMRLFKLVEEAGEVAEAWIGIQGQNPLKGVTHTAPELIGELGDVAFTALVAAASFGAHPYDVLAAIAAKMRVRLDPAPAAVQARGEGRVTAGLPPGGGDGEHHPTAGEHEVAETRDVFAMLTAVAHAQTRRFPRHNGAFERLARLHEESGEVAKLVNHAEDTGVKTQRYGPFNPQDLAGEIVDVLLTAVGLAVHYQLEDRLPAVIQARRDRYRDLGHLPDQTSAP